MRLIKQGDDNGCGLACVAMAAGTTYAAVRKTYQDVCRTGPGDKVEPTQLPVLKEIMRHHDVAIEGRERRFSVRKPGDLDHDALVRINPRKGGDEWHWVIWDRRRRRLLDPKKKAYERLKFISYWKLRRISDDAEVAA